MPKELRPLGAVRDPIDPKDIQFRSLMPATVQVDLPRTYSLKSQLWFKAFRQKYGSCVGGAGRYIIQYYRHKWYNEKRIVSDRFIYGRSKEMDGQPDDEGTWPRICLMGMFGEGAPLFERWNHENTPTHAEFIKSPPLDIREEAIENVLTGGIARVTSYEELKKAIFTQGPVMVTLAVYDTYDDADGSGNIERSDGTGFRGYHENIAIGWNDDTQEIEIMNQWGTGWGDDGIAMLPINYDPQRNFPLFDMWAITDLISASVTAGAPVELGYPVETPTPFITQAFGVNKPAYQQYGMDGHNGLDFRTKDTNKFIIAAADGEIISMNPNDGGYGKAVRIRHPWGMSIYAHNSQFIGTPYANDGSPRKVKRGERIAIAGCTGNCNGEHCHFGIRINGVKNPGFLDWVDPTPYFKEKQMTKYFRIDQDGKLGILILEGFSGTGLFENDWAEYQKLLQITNGTASAPVIKIPTGKFLRIDDHGKQGILVSDGFAMTVLFENEWTDYQTLLAISGMSMNNPLVLVP